MIKDKWTRIPPKDSRNYAGVYYRQDDTSIMIADESFGQVDTERMVIMEESQLRELLCLWLETNK